LCTPIGHDLADLALYSFSNVGNRKRWAIFCIVLFFAIFPDIGLLFGFVFDDADKYHHQFTHSFFLLLLLTLLVL
jgi:hypothetical protein